MPYLVVGSLGTGSPSSLQDIPPVDSSIYEYLRPIPQECEELRESLEEAIDGHELGKLTIIELKVSARCFPNIPSCPSQ